MKIRIYFNFCEEGSINLVYQDFNIVNTFKVNFTERKLYFFYKHEYHNINFQYINSIVFNDKEYQNIEIGGKILGSIPADTQMLEFIENIH